MRHGRLLAEDTPSNLLSAHSASSLESVFLKLCVQDNSPGSNLGLATDKKSSGLTGTLTRTLKLGSVGHAGTLSRKEGGGAVYPGITAVADDCSIQAISYHKKPVEESEFQKIKRRLSMKVQRTASFRSKRRGSNPGPGLCQATLPYPRNVLALVTKNLIKMRRNLSQLLFIFLLPALEVIFFCGAIGRDPAGLKLGALNLEVDGDFAACNHTLDGCDFTHVGCRFFDTMFQQDNLVRRNFSDAESALKAVRDGEVTTVQP